DALAFPVNDSTRGHVGGASLPLTPSPGRVRMNVGDHPRGRTRAMTLSREEFMEFCRNQQAFPSEKYEPYLGDWIAFNREGTEILLRSAISFADVVAQP